MWIIAMIKKAVVTFRKAEMNTIQQQIEEGKKNESTNALKEIKHLCKEFDFTDEC